VGMDAFKLWQRLAFAFAVVVGIIIFLGGLTVYAKTRITNSYQEALEHTQEAQFLDQKLGDHYRWLLQLDNQLIRDEQFHGQLDPHKCGFGQWYYGMKEGSSYSQLDPESRRILDSIESPHMALHASGEKIKALYGQDKQQMIDIYREETDPAVDELVVLLDEYKQLRQQDALSKVAAAEEIVVVSSRLILLFIIAGILMAIVSGIFITRSLAKPLSRLIAEAKSIGSTGDLSKRVTVSGKDEVSEVAASINEMLDNTAGPVRELSDAAKVISAGDLTREMDIRSKGDIASLVGSFKEMAGSLRRLIGDIKSNSGSMAASSEQLSASAEEVDASMQQVSSTVQEIAKGAQQVSKGAGEAQDASKKTSDSASAGSQAAKLVNEKMLEISSSTKEGAMKVKSLGEKSAEIGKIVDTIQNISEQTNLLALNAAIEAARAGEAGRGFAVVADEVRKLAEESGKASGQISELIQSIQSEIGSAVSSMDANSRKVDDGADAVLEALKSFDQIPQLVGDVSKVMSEMAAIAEENAAGSEEVSASVEEVTGAMQQVSSAAQQLSSSAEQLKQLVSRFRI